VQQLFAFPTDQSARRRTQHEWPLLRGSHFANRLQQTTRTTGNAEENGKLIPGPRREPAHRPWGSVLPVLRFVRSEAECLGKGTRVTVEFPLVRGAEPQQEA